MTGLFAQEFSQKNYQEWKQAEAEAIKALANIEASLTLLEKHEASILQWRLFWRKKMTLVNESALPDTLSKLTEQLIELEKSKKEKNLKINKLDGFLKEDIITKRIPFLQAQIANLSADALAARLDKKIYEMRRAALLASSGIPFGFTFLQNSPPNGASFIDFTLYPRVYYELKEAFARAFFLKSDILELYLLLVFIILIVGLKSIAPQNIAKNILPIAFVGFSLIIAILAYKSTIAPSLITFYWAIIFYITAFYIGYVLRANDGVLLSQYWPTIRFNLRIMAGCYGAHILIRSFVEKFELSYNGQALLEFFPFGIACYGLYIFSRNFAKYSIRSTQKGFIQLMDSLLARSARWGVPSAVLLFILQRTNASIALIYAIIASIILYLLLKILWAKILDLFKYFNMDNETPKVGGLLPVFINIFITFLALPIFAFIWGARKNDLIDFWRAIGSDLTIGGISITPQNIALFILIFGVAYAFIKAFQNNLKTTILPQTGINLGLQNAISSGFGYVGISLAAIIAITTAGINLSSLAIVAGALSIGIGFGLQNIVSNFVSGIILLIERPISEGDWIDAGGHQGYVRNISVRSTRIEGFDQSEFIIPNSQLISNAVTNYTKTNYHGRLIIPIAVDYNSDTRKVQEILTEIGQNSPYRLKSIKPSVLFKNFGDSALDFELRVILRNVNDILTAKSEINHTIIERFRKENINIPFPQRDIRLYNTSASQKGTQT